MILVSFSQRLTALLSAAMHFLGINSASSELRGREENVNS
jgi:hypothetical protein